jgi:pyruvate formate lyase activating enzyme
MKILGYQKTSFIDYPNKVCSSLFLFGCNFRCGFCHNPELVLFDENYVKNEFNQEEILSDLKKRKKILDGVCISGGEPLLSLEKDFLKKIKEIGYLIKIDTNGSNPEKLKELIEEGFVDFVSMDIKNCPEDYNLTCGVEVDLKKIEESIKIVCNLEDYEFRTTVVEGLHNKEKIKELGKWVKEVCGKKPKSFVLQGFRKETELLNKEFMKKINTKEEKLIEMKDLIKEYFEDVKMRV